MLASCALLLATAARGVTGPEAVGCCAAAFIGIVTSASKLTSADKRTTALWSVAKQSARVKMLATCRIKVNMFTDSLVSFPASWGFHAA
jgi:hypothetical protein